MKIFLASDHNGVMYLNDIQQALEKKYDVVRSSLENNTLDDYPDFVYDVCKKMNEDDIAILFCGSGIGVSIAANKIKGVYCAKINNVEEAKLAKKHNHVNALAIGTSFHSLKEILEMITVFLENSYDNDDRHLRRLEKIIKIERDAYDEL